MVIKTTHLFHGIFQWYSVNAATIFAVCVITAIAGEGISRLVLRRDLQLRSVRTSLLSGAAFMATKTILGKVAYLSMALYLYTNHRLFNLDMANPLIWIGIFLIRDVVYYWVHRMEHSVRFLWASHLVHHSPETIGMSSAVRVPWMEAIYKPWFGLWLPLLGFNPLAAIAFDVFAATLAQLQHTKHFRARQGGTLLGRVFVTPSSHRVHHGYNPEYIDKNFGAVLIIWDRLFGTYEPEVAPVKFGVGPADAVETGRDALVGGYPRLISEMRKAKSIKAAVGVAISAP